MRRAIWERMLDIDRIASQFIPTRGRPWKPVLSFLRLLGGGFLGDFGCGNGRHSFAAVNIGFEVVALDISVSLINHIRRKRIPTLHPVVGSITHPPFKNNAFDAVILIATLHNIPTLRLRLKALWELWRTLRRGGWAMITVWSALTHGKMQRLRACTITSTQFMIVMFMNTQLRLRALHKPIAICSVIPGKTLSRIFRAACSSPNSSCLLSLEIYGHLQAPRIPDGV